MVEPTGRTRCSGGDPEIEFRSDQADRTRRPGLDDVGEPSWNGISSPLRGPGLETPGSGGLVWATLGHPWNGILVGSVSHSGVHHLTPPEEDDLASKSEPLLGSHNGNLSRFLSFNVSLFADAPPAALSSRPRGFRGQSGAEIRGPPLRPEMHFAKRGAITTSGHIPTPESQPGRPQSIPH
ncbi:hypothetical protein ACLKA6_008559 [Drosophila palustris]